MINSRLENYLTSYGVALPKDFVLYTPTGLLNDKCVFCKAKHYQAFRIQARVSKMSTYVYACASCFDIIEDNKLDNHLDRSLETQIELSIQQFCASGLMPNDADRYSQGCSLDEQCVFCSQFVHNNYDGYLIPEGQYSTIRGPVKVCVNCSDTISLYDGPGKEQVTYDTCSLCKNSHPVTIEEYEAREAYETLGKHICSYCNKNNWSKPRLSFGDTCKNCGGILNIDRTLPFPSFCIKCSKTQMEIPFDKALTINFNEYTINIYGMACRQRNNTVAYIYKVFKNGNIVNALSCNPNDCDSCALECFHDAFLASYEATKRILEQK